MAFRLIFINREGPEGEQAETRDFDKELITIGRHSTNDIQITHAGASRQHCKVVFEDGNYFLIDPGSANGTTLNGRKIPLKRNQLLKDNDLIGVESYEFRFKTMNRVAVKGPGESTDEVALRVVREVLGSLQTKNHPLLEIFSGPNKGKIVDLDKDVQQVIIGRSDACDLVLNDAMISRRNTKIRRDWTGVTITDLNSKNGTFVNDKKVTEQILQDGDEIRIGESRLTFRNPKQSFGKELEGQESSLGRHIEESVVPEAVKAPPLIVPDQSPAPTQAPQTEPSHAPMQHTSEASAQEDYEAESPEGIMQNIKPIDLAIIGAGIVVVIACVVILFKILF